MAGPQLRGRIGIDGEKEFKAAMKDAGNAVKLVDSELQLLSAQFKSGEASMEMYQRQQELLTNKLQAQKSQVATMESVLAAVKAKYGENSDEATKYAVQLNKAKAAVAQTEGELEKCNGKLDEFRQGMEDAGDASEELGDALNEGESAAENQGEAAEGAGEKNEKLKEAAAAAGAVMKGAVVAGAKAAAAAIVALGAAAGAGVVALTNMGTSYQQASNMLSAQTGTTGAELQQLSGVAQDVFRKGFGENIGEVNEALAVTKTNTGLMGDELKKATEAGFLLRDTFGFEFQESSRTARTLMKNFGISAEEAYNLIATGAQNGANQNGDMLDVIAEYGPMFAQMGMSADQMISGLIAGNEAGVFSIDKVGDAMKEFSIRCVDGSETTKEAMKSIGLDADAMAQQFAMGGENARYAFQTTVEAIMAIEDPVKRSQTAVQLFGTQFEDLGPEILPILADMAAGGELTAEALEQIANVRYDDFSSSAQGFMRLVQAEFLPTAQQFSAIAKGVADDARIALMDGFQPEDVRAIGVSVAEALIEGITAVQDLMDSALPVYADVVDMIGETLTTLLPALIDTVLPAAMTLLDGMLGAISSNMQPLINTATNLVTSLAGFLSSNASKLVTAARNLLTGLVRGISQALPQLVPAALSIIGELGVGLIEAMPQLIAQIPVIFGGIIEGIASMDWVDLGRRLLNAIKNGLASIGATLLTLFEDGKQLVTEIDWASVGSAIKAGATAALDAAGTWLSGLFSTAWTAVKKIDWGSIGNAILNGATSVLDTAGAWLSGLFSTAWTAVKDIDWGSIGNAILEGATSLFDAAGNWLSSLFGGGKTASESLSWGDVGNAIKTGATSTLDDAGRWLSDLFSAAWTAVKNIDWGSIGGVILSGATSLFDAAGSWLSSLFGSGKTASEGLSWADVGSAIKAGATSTLDAAGNWLSGLFSTGKDATEGLSWSDIGSTIKTGATGVLDAAGSFLSAGFTAGKTAIETVDWSTIGSTILSGVTGVIDAGGAFLLGGFTAGKAAVEEIDWSSIGTAIGSGINGVIDVAGAFLSGCFTAAKATIDSINWAGVGATIGTGVNDVIDTAGAFLSGCFTAAKATIDSIDWAGIGTAISTGVNGVIDTAGAFLSGCFTAAKATIDGINWAGIGTAISTGVNGVIDTAGAFLSGCFTAAKATIDGINWAGIGTAISTGVNGVIDTAGAWLSGSFTAAKATIVGIDWAGIGTAISTGVNSVIDTAGAWLSGSFTAAKATIEGIDWAGLGTTISNGFNSALDVLGGIGTSILDGLAWLFGGGDNGGTEVDLLDGVAVGIQNGTVTVQEVSRIAAEACLSTFRDTLAKEDVGGNWIAEIAARITESAVSVETAVQTLAKMARKALTDGFPSRYAEVTASTFAGKVSAGIKSKRIEVSSAAGGLGNAAINALWAAVGTDGSKFNGIGLAVSTGVAAGITSGQSSIISAAQEAARAAYEAACDELDIHSPSRKGKSIGKNYTESIAMGMDESRKQVTRAAAAMTGAANSTTHQTLRVQTTAIDYDRLGQSVARANREAGLGNLELYVGKEKLGQTLEPTVMRAGQTRSQQTVTGRGARMALV